MTERKTLQLRDPSETADAAPTIKKKGRGWEISEKRLDALHDRARDLRRHSSDPLCDNIYSCTMRRTAQSMCVAELLL